MNTSEITAMVNAAAAREIARQDIIERRQQIAQRAQATEKLRELRRDIETALSKPPKPEPPTITAEQEHEAEVKRYRRHWAAIREWDRNHKRGLIPPVDPYHLAFESRRLPDLDEQERCCR